MVGGLEAERKESLIFISAPKTADRQQRRVVEDSICHGSL